jgi:hypothetical protein
LIKAVIAGHRVGAMRRPDDRLQRAIQYSGDVCQYQSSANLQKERPPRGGLSEFNQLLL